MRTFRNVHERTINAPADAVAALFDQVGSDTDPLWPAPAWVPMRLDRPLAVGADGGHGPIRYWVSAYDPGHRVRFTFHPEVGIDGYHELTIEPIGSGRCIVRHVLEGRPRGLMRLAVPLVIRPLHDAVLEDLLDNAERAATGRVERPARWSPWVRFWRFAEFPRPRAVPLPEDAGLARSAFDEIAFTDSFRVPLARGVSTDPQLWADAIFRDPPRWVAYLIGLRNALARLVGIERGDHSAFDTVAAGSAEVLLGIDASHLDFRASVLVEAKAVTLTTVVGRIHNRRGRLYWAIVKHIHPAVVRSMLRRAARRLALRAWDERHAALRL